MRALTMRQEYILLYLRDNPGARLRDIVDDSPIDEQRSSEYMAEHPSGKPLPFPSIAYGTCAQSMKRLLDEGMVRREGDPLLGYHHFFVRFPERTDPLEAALAEVEA